MSLSCTTPGDHRITDRLYLSSGRNKRSGKAKRGSAKGSEWLICRNCWNAVRTCSAWKADEKKKKSAVDYTSKVATVVNGIYSAYPYCSENPPLAMRSSSQLHWIPLSPAGIPLDGSSPAPEINKRHTEKVKKRPPMKRLGNDPSGCTCHLINMTPGSVI